MIAYSQEGFDFLRTVLTETKMAEYFLPLRPSSVERFELPGIFAFNFLLHNALGGGASRSLRIDSQGKTLALALLEMEIAKPNNFDLMRKPIAEEPA